MTTRHEVLSYAGELSDCEGRDLIESYERWFRQRGDRHLARYCRLDNKALAQQFAELAAENYADAKALRNAIRGCK
jgi:hypothetical protein